MKSYINIFGMTLAAALLISGCTEQELTEPVNPVPSDLDKQEIQFKFFVEEGNQIIPYEDYWNAVNQPSRGTTRAANSDLPSEFTLYGVFNTIDVPDGKSSTLGSSEAAPVNKRFFNGVTINGDGTYTGEPRYWVADGKTRHSFAAIAGLSTWSVALSEGFTTAQFIPSTLHYIEGDPLIQTDLLVAYGPTNVIVSGVAPVVNIHFKHALSKLRFSITSSGGAALYDCVLSVIYNGPMINTSYYYTAKLQAGGYSGMWSTYPLNSAVTIPTTANTEDNAVEMGNIKIHALNQSTAGWINLLLNFAKTHGGPTTEIKTRLPAINLQSGMQYNIFAYVSEITEELSITGITVEPWTTEIRVADPLD